MLGQECLCSSAKQEWIEEKILKNQVDGEGERLNDKSLEFKVERLIR